jgi:hypothetical protein
MNNEVIEMEGTTTIDTNSNTKVREAVAYFTSALENTVKEVFEIAGSKIGTEQREEIQQSIRHSIRLLEKLKNK